MNQNEIIVALIGAVGSVVAALVSWMLHRLEANRSRSEPAPRAAPVVNSGHITAPRGQAPGSLAPPGRAPGKTWPRLFLAIPLAASGMLVAALLAPKNAPQGAHAHDPRGRRPQPVPKELAIHTAASQYELRLNGQVRLIPAGDEGALIDEREDGVYGFIAREDVLKVNDQDLEQARWHRVPKADVEWEVHNPQGLHLRLVAYVSPSDARAAGNAAPTGKTTLLCFPKTDPKYPHLVSIPQPRIESARIKHRDGAFAAEITLNP